MRIEVRFDSQICQYAIMLRSTIATELVSILRVDMYVQIIIDTLTMIGPLSTIPYLTYKNVRMRQN